jgi:ABC-type transporter Mla subunit MlaD
LSEFGINQKRERRAGVVIILTLLLGLASLMSYSYWRKHSGNTTQSQVVFDIASGVEGLQPGSQVFYGGINIGSVTGVTYKDGEIYVNTSILSEFKLHEGVKIHRQGSLIGGKASFVVSSFGDTTGDPLPRNARIEATPMKGGAGRILGEQDFKRVDNIQSTFDETYTSMKMVAEDARRLGSAGQAFMDFSSEVDDDIVIWSPRLDAIEARLESISGQFDAIRSDAGPLREESRAIVSEANALADSITERVDPMQKDLEDLADRLQVLGSRFEDDILPLARELAARGEQSWTDSQESLERLRALGTEGSRSVRTFIANSTLAAQQLKRAESEIIGSLGLDLLQRPSVEDQVRLIREEAMSDWIRTAGRIAMLLEMLESIRPEGDEDSEETRLLGRLVNELRATLAEYDAVQAGLFKPDEAPDPVPARPGG